MTDRYENIRRALADMDAAAEARNALAWGDAHARLAAHVAPNTIRVLLAERDDLLENGKQAIRWAPSSAHWSNELKRLFGDDARLGIDALESKLRNAQAERDALREEAAEWKRVAAAQAELHGEAEDRAERLAEALRKLEEREQSDEALLRQALKALELFAWDSLIGRNAAYAIRDRLGLGQEVSHDNQ